MTSAEIRKAYIDFFVQKHGHTFVPSSPVVPHDDPTLLFTNAGMNQFKPIFLGTEKRAYTRAVNSQKCIRAGGKHNDLDDVGRSRRHHTFFEMLGNWSFGDYFKRGAIEMSWELLTKVWKLDPSRIHVSCFQGDEKNGIPRDTEAANIWKEVAGLGDDHIHYFGDDNFWAMGDTGPCGPCTEIYYDRTPDKTGGPQVNGDDPRVMEIWNNVFIQYNRDADGKLTTLPAQHVDTGMGLERICQVLQNVESNYEIDLFLPFWAKLKELSGLTYTGKYPHTNAPDPVAEAASAQLRYDIAFRVIADHIRALTFAITDGAIPSNDKRGSVLRRILRRAVRYGRQTLELREPFLHQLVPIVVEAMGDAFPELRSQSARVASVVKEEEESFDKTLDRGLEIFNEYAAIALSSDRTIGGKVAFDLHTEKGFPIDMTEQMAAERGLKVDIDGYKRLFKEFQDTSGAGRARSVTAALDFRDIKGTNDSEKYQANKLPATIVAIVDSHDEMPIVNTAGGRLMEGHVGAAVLDQTCFYAEQGGQVGDTGYITSPTGVFKVTNTIRNGDYVIHEGFVESGAVRTGDDVQISYDATRGATEKNHTTTHIANWALREVLGEDVQQKGSLVDPEKLRFDFSHGKAMSDEEIGRVESLTSERIAKKLAVYAETAPQEQAIKINGLRAVFGEKYPPMVRVVSIGVPVKDLLADPGNAKWREFSVEFCGGTHLKNSGDAEGFVVIGEESVSKGIRRIVALTGVAASAATSAAKELDASIAYAKGMPEAEIPKAIAALQKYLGETVMPLRAKRRGQAAVAELQAKFKAFEKSQKTSSGSGVDAVAIAGELLKSASDLGGGKIVVGEIAGASQEQLLSAIDSLKKKTGSYGILLASASDGKVNFVAVVSDDLIAKGLKAGDWIRETAKIAGGGGGGRPQMAQAGGKDPAKIGEALEVAKAFVKKMA